MAGYGSLDGFNANLSQTIRRTLLFHVLWKQTNTLAHITFVLVSSKDEFAVFGKEAHFSTTPILKSWNGWVLDCINGIAETVPSFLNAKLTCHVNIFTLTLLCGAKYNFCYCFTLVLSWSTSFCTRFSFILHLSETKIPSRNSEKYLFSFSLPCDCKAQLDHEP